MLDVKNMLEEVKASPYKEILVTAPHTGRVEFAGPAPGAVVAGPGSKESGVPGTLLANLTREGNTKPVCAPLKGELVEIYASEPGVFVQAGDPLAKIRHFLTRDEVIDLILQKALNLFTAPERAKYYFIPTVDLKIKASGVRSVKVRDAMELFIVSRMKRESFLSYAGPEGLIYAVYFQQGENVDAGAPLIGVCPESQLSNVEDVVAKVQSEWEEPE